MRFLILLLAVTIISQDFVLGLPQHHGLEVGVVEYSKLPLIFGKKLEIRDVVSEEVFQKIQAASRERNPSRGITAVINEYADKIFENVQKFMINAGLEPMDLPDLHTGFNYTLIITYHGELDLTNGWVADLSTIRRNGDVVVEYSSDDKYLTVDIPLTFDDLQFVYDYSAKIMNLGPTGKAEGRSSKIEVVVQIGFDMNTFHASVQNFDIVNTGPIHVVFSGDILIDWLLNLLSDVAVVILKPMILGIVQDVVEGGLNSVVEIINDFVDSILNPNITTTIPEMSIKTLLFG